MNSKETVRDAYSFLTLQASSRLHRKTPESYAEHKQALPAIILIPGFFEHWGMLRKISDTLSDRGYDIFTVPKLGENLSDIKTTADKIEETTQRNHLLWKVYLGHSYGGIMAYYMARFHESSRAIAIAAPFLGSDLAEHARLIRIARTMAPHSPVLQELIDYIGDTNSRVVSIYPKSDNIIPNGSYLDGAENIEINTVGHHNILRHVDVRRDGLFGQT